MPRVKRATLEPLRDPVNEALLDMLALIDKSLPAEPGAELDAAHSAKFDRKMDKARAMWDRLTPAERKAWSDDYYREAYRRDPRTKRPGRESEIRELFAVVHVAERTSAKWTKQATKAAAEAEVERLRLKAATAARRREIADEKAVARTTRPSAAPERTADGDEPPKRRKRRVGPIGSAGFQIGGRFYAHPEDDTNGRDDL